MGLGTGLIFAFVMDFDPLLDPDPEVDSDPGLDPDPRWIRIFKSPDPDPESESPKGQKSDSGSGSRAGIVTPTLWVCLDNIPWKRQESSKFPCELGRTEILYYLLVRDIVKFRRNWLIEEQSYTKQFLNYLHDIKQE